jgi:signal peptide peptidase SppA
MEVIDRILDWYPWLQRHRPPVVSVLRLEGVIAQSSGMRKGLNLASQAMAIEKAFSVRNLVAVALCINSPGGSPVQSALIAKRIRDLAEEKSIPVIAFAEDVAASGGYWLACAGDEVYANESSIIGSIGVISGGFGFTELINKIGIERRLYVSGDKKSILDPFAPEKPADVKYLKSLQKEIHGTFAKMVKARRGKRLVGAEKDIFSGAFWTGSKALEIGLIDGIGDLRSVMRKRFGDKVRLRQIGVPQSFWRQRLGLSESLGNNAGLLDTENMATSILSTIEERLTWSRFGL